VRSWLTAYDERVRSWQGNRRNKSWAIWGARTGSWENHPWHTQAGPCAVQAHIGCEIHARSKHAPSPGDEPSLQDFVHIFLSGSMEPGQGHKQWTCWVPLRIDFASRMLARYTEAVCHTMSHTPRERPGDCLARAYFLIMALTGSNISARPSACRACSSNDLTFSMLTI
jgi:hypothetical protein